ncbi:Leucine_Rich Repeat (LRR)-containing protein [Hexamita inflata]|uniref:Leucine Rich Repeat (LRR)-containing protein n=1 Tax=Hexamita inflata TaxID=28002 RepID=A0AA86R9P5_9EUKA|nr:Leucine Rich Repeat (LRR)-containing protein [Hexamita inflata]
MFSNTKYFEYINDVDDAKLFIFDDQNITDQLIASQLSGQIEGYGKQIDTVVIINCPNIQCRLQHPLKSLSINCCGLTKICCLPVELVHLDLGDNKLDDASNLGSLFNLKRLILRSNKINRLDCLKSLVKLEHLDVSFNNLVYVDFITYLPLLTDFQITGNCICNLFCVVEHPKCSNCIMNQTQRDPTLDDVWQYLGQCTKQQLNSEFDSVQIQVIQRNEMLSAQEIAKNAGDESWITINNLSEQDYDKIKQCLNYNYDFFQNLTQKILIIHDSSKSNDILSKIAPHIRNLKVQVEPIRSLQITSKKEHLDLSCYNKFNIQDLLVHWCDDISLLGITSVKYLNIKCCGLKSLEGIQNLNELQQLQIYFCELESVEQLGSLKQQLIKVLFRDNKLISTKGLQILKNHTVLELQGNLLSSLEGMEQLTNLTNLDLSRNQLKSVGQLKNLTNLINLNLNDNFLENVTELGNLENLVDLNLRNNILQNLDGLEKLTNLQIIDLFNNQISSLKGMRNLQNLTTVNLINNKLRSVDGLKNLPKLQILLLQSNQLQTLKGLDNFPNLMQLELQDNQLVNTEGLKQLPKLTVLYLSTNKLTSINGLENLLSLESLHLRGNLIKDFTAISHKKYKYIGYQDQQ